MTDADYENMSAFSCGVKELDYFFIMKLGNVCRDIIYRHILYI